MKLYYTTFPDDESREHIAEQVMTEKLVGCVVATPVSSIYPWKDELQNEEEVAALFKTTAARADAFTERLEELHPYDVPCLLEIPVNANPAYEEWLEDVTS